jgi:hypothetical protein
MQDLRKAADLTADRTGKADCQVEAGMILQKQKDYRGATAAFEVTLLTFYSDLIAMYPDCSASHRAS